MPFIYKEEYSQSEYATLNYVVYDENHDVKLSSTDFPISVVRGSNKIKIDCLHDKLGGVGVYILEVTTTKNEKLYLRFGVSQSTTCN